MKTQNLKGSSQEDCLKLASAKVQEEEFCRILDLRKGLQFSDMLIKHSRHYLSLGWQLAVLNSQSRAQQWFNFQEPQESWSEKLIELSLDGVEVNVGVQTGSASRLMILEVAKQGRSLPFRREDWSANCVAETGVLFEQHYYELPEGWQPPPSFVLEPFEVKVFGEGDLVLTPPSLDPRTQANWRWLRPPWDSAPSPLPPILKKIIKVAAAAPAADIPAPKIPSGEEIYPEIAPHPLVMQALMSPAASPESYYQNLLEAALAEGLNEPQLLLALMWHAPLGNVQERPGGWEYLQQLLARGSAAGGYCGGGPEVEDPQVAAVRALFKESRRLPETRRGFPPVGRNNGGRASFTQPSAAGDWRAREHLPHNQQPGGFSYDNRGFGWQEWFKASQENLMVERHRYEAMIYELGKLQVWQEICQQERRENQRLQRKLEAQAAREVDYLRDLLKKDSRPAGWEGWEKAVLMKTLKDNADAAIPYLGTPGAASDLYLEIEPRGQNTSSRLPVQVKNLADAGIILEISDLPNGFDGEAFLQQPAVIHLAPDRVTKETQLPSKVVWVRQGENGTGHYLLGLDLGEADFRTRRVLEKFVTRPKDMFDLWTYWDQVQPKPAKPTAHSHDNRIVFFLGAGVSLAGVALKVALPSSYDIMAMTLTLVGIYLIAGKCLWNWWRGRTVPKES